MKNKDFDCVEMMHQCGQTVMKKIEGMTLKEQLVYWQAAANELRKLQQQPKGKTESSVSSLSRED